MMKITWHIILVFLLNVISFNGVAQELQATVLVNTPSLQQADPAIFQKLQNDMQDFINSMKWTQDEFKDHEKIKCSFTLNINEEISQTRFKGELFVQSFRPVYGTSQETITFLHSDNTVAFDFDMGTVISYNENSYLDNLSSVISFYAFIILGADYDTFSPNGGKPYYLKAQSILNSVPQSEATTYGGWSQTQGSNARFWITESVISPRMAEMHRAMYEYHRGLDLFHADIVKGRETIMAAIEKMNTANNNYFSAKYTQIVVNAKREEILSIFKEGTTEQKNKIKDFMTKMDGANSNRYRNI